MGVFWARSYFYYDAVYYSNLERTHQLFTVPGSVAFSTWNHLPADDFVWDGASGPIESTPMKLYRDGDVKTLDGWDHPAGMIGGFWWEKASVQKVKPDGVTFAQTHVNLAIPFWAVVIFFLLAPVAWSLKLWQRYHRAKTGHCIYCNTVMPTPDRCPGCEREFEHWVL